MAILSGTIQHRRGADKDFDASKMLPGELAVTTDGSRRVYAAFAAGDVKELASKEEVEQTISDGIAAIEEKKQEALENIGTGVDSSLTQEGKAADAAETGKAITELKSDIADEAEYLKSLNYDTRLTKPYELVIGFYDGNTPSTNGNYSRYLSTPLLPLQDVRVKVIGSIDENLKFTVSLFDAYGNFTKTTRANTDLSTGEYEATAGWITNYGANVASYFRLGFYRYPSENITSKIEVLPLDDSANIAKKTIKIEEDVSELKEDVSQKASEVAEIVSNLSDDNNYFKRFNYDTRLTKPYELVVGYFNGNTPSTNGNYSKYLSTPLLNMQDVHVKVIGAVDTDLKFTVSLFDADGNFIKNTRNNTDLSTGEYEATAGWITNYGANVASYFRLGFYRYPSENITSKIEVLPLDDSDNIAKKAMFVENSTLEKMSIELDKTMFESGYLGNKGVVIPSNEYKISPYIEVVEGMEATITKLSTAGWKIIACYDSEKNFIKEIIYKAYKTTNLASVDVFIPYGTRYIRYAVANGMLNTTTCNYKMQSIPKHYIAPSLMEMWKKQSFGKIGNLFEKATERALITIIDDDTKNTQFVTLFHDACEAKEIKGSYAVITYRFETDPTLKDTLLSFEDEGYGMYAHCYIQDAKWAAQNYTLIDADIRRCLREMRASGFVNYKYWLTPGGHCEPQMQDLGKRLGMKCMVSSGNSEIETTEAKYGRYNIKRCTLEANQNKAGALTVDDFKLLIDETVACGGWLLITTHFGNGEWDETAINTRFNEVVDYAKSRYMKFTTLAEAFETRKPIYDFYDMF